MNTFLKIPLEQRLVGIFLVGLIIGSFINWAIYQFAWQPRSISPWSKLPSQLPARKWYDRIPLVGWFSLARESSIHGTGFWIRPLLLELITAGFLMWLYSWEINGNLLPGRFFMGPARLPSQILNTNIQIVIHAQYLVHVALFMALMIASWTDVDGKYIPDIITLPGILLGLMFAAIFPWSLLANELVILPSGAQTIKAIDFLKVNSPTNTAWPAVIGAKPSISGLAIGLACYWFFWFAYLDLRTRWFKGWRVALAIARRRIVKDLNGWITRIVMIGGTAGIVSVWWFAPINWVGLFSSLVGMVVGMSIVWAVRLIAGPILQKEAMGFGDVTLMGMIGAFIGWQLCIIVFFMAAVFGLIYGIVQMIINRDPELFYGPFLSLSAIVVVVRWASFWRWARPIYFYGWLVPIALVSVFFVMAILLFLIQRVKILFLKDAGEI